MKGSISPCVASGCIERKTFVMVHRVWFNPQKHIPLKIGNFWKTLRHFFLWKPQRHVLVQHLQQKNYGPYVLAYLIAFLRISETSLLDELIFKTVELERVFDLYHIICFTGY
jgi:hypothetical protein